MGWPGGTAPALVEGAGKAMKLTSTQQHHLATYARLRVELGKWPTLRELGEALGLWLVGQAGFGLMRRLEAKGCLVLGPPASARTARLTPLGWRLAEVEPPRELAERRVWANEGHVCTRCGARTFALHDPRTCAQLLTGLTFAQLASAAEATQNGGAYGAELRP